MSNRERLAYQDAVAAHYLKDIKDNPMDLSRVFSEYSDCYGEYLPDTATPEQELEWVRSCAEKDWNDGRDSLCFPELAPSEEEEEEASTVAAEWGMRCPTCSEDDNLEIAMTVLGKLTPDGTDTDDVSCGDHEWDDDSPCSCRSCGFTGKVRDFEIDLVKEALGDLFGAVGSELSEEHKELEARIRVLLKLREGESYVG